MPFAYNAVDFLKEDHRKLESLFASYDGARIERARIAKQICLELVIHTILEEELFYPACRGIVQDDDLDRAQVEHDSAKALITELQAGSPGDIYYDAKVKVLSEDIRHHVSDEERVGGIFLQVINSDLDLAALGQQMAALKAELLAEFGDSGIPAPGTRSMKVMPVEQGTTGRPLL